MKRPHPWEVWWTDFSPQVGREQAGRRPAIIVGSDLACRLPNGLAIVVPMTSTNRSLPFQPAVQLGDRTGYAMTEQVKAISVDRLVARHPASPLGPDQAEPIRFALQQMLSLTV